MNNRKDSSPLSAPDGSALGVIPEWNCLKCGVKLAEPAPQERQLINMRSDGKMRIYDLCQECADEIAPNVKTKTHKLHVTYKRK